MAQCREIQTMDEWTATFQASTEHPVFLFKHSTRCPVSARAWKEFQAFIETTSHTEIDYVMVKVIQSREVSNEIERCLGIKHESPQAIFVQNQVTTWHASHNKITQKQLEAIIL